MGGGGLKICMIYSILSSPVLAVKDVSSQLATPPAILVPSSFLFAMMDCYKIWSHIPKYTFP